MRPLSFWSFVFYAVVFTFVYYNGFFLFDTNHSLNNNLNQKELILDLEKKANQKVDLASNLELAFRADKEELHILLEDSDYFTSFQPQIEETIVLFLQDKYTVTLVIDQITKTVKTAYYFHYDLYSNSPNEIIQNLLILGFPSPEFIRQDEKQFFFQAGNWQIIVNSNIPVSVWGQNTTGEKLRYQFNYLDDLTSN